MDMDKIQVLIRFILHTAFIATQRFAPADIVPDTPLHCPPGMQVGVAEGDICVWVEEMDSAREQKKTLSHL